MKLRRSLLTFFALSIALGFLILLWVRSAMDAAYANQQRLEQKERQALEQVVEERVNSFRSLLDELDRAESAVPFYQYQNAYVDPRSPLSQPIAVVSPFVNSQNSPYVITHFEVDRSGKLSYPAPLDMSRKQLGDAIASHIGHELALPPDNEALALGRPNRTVRRSIVNAPASNVADVATAPVTQAPVNNTNIGLGNAYTPQQQSYQIPAQNLYTGEKAQKLLAKQQKEVETITQNYAVTVDPFVWQKLALGDGIAVVASRLVTHPFGNVMQSFVVDWPAMTQVYTSQVPGLKISLEDIATDERGNNIITRSIRQDNFFISFSLPMPQALAAPSLHATLGEMFWLVLALSLAAAALATLLVWQSAGLAEKRAAFAAAAAHELRTPLASIQLHGELLAEGLGNPAKHKLYAQRVAEESSRLGRVVSNVLGFSQLERNSLQTTTARYDVAEIVAQLVDRTKPLLAKSNMTLSWNMPAQPFLAKCDRDAVERILTNVIDNAEKYSRDAKVRELQLTLHASRNQVVVSVSDQGPGISRDAQRALFNPFVRGRNSGPSGLGLGLALSRELARSMNGDLVLASASNPTRFELRLPVAS